MVVTPIKEGLRLVPGSLWLILLRTALVLVAALPALFVAAAGVAIGLSAAVGLTRFLSTLLYDVQPVDPVTYVTAAAAVVVVSLLASYVPARRAAKVDPMQSLRGE